MASIHWSLLCGLALAGLLVRGTLADSPAPPAHYASYALNLSPFGSCQAEKDAEIGNRRSAISASKPPAPTMSATDASSTART